MSFMSKTIFNESRLLGHVQAVHLDQPPTSTVPPPSTFPPPTSTIQPPTSTVPQPDIKTEAVDEETLTTMPIRKTRRKTSTAAASTTDSTLVAESPKPPEQQVVHLNDLYAGKQVRTDDTSLRCQQYLKPVLCDMLSVQLKSRNTLDVKAEKVSHEIHLLADNKTYVVEYGARII